MNYCVNDTLLEGGQEEGGGANGLFSKRLGVLDIAIKYINLK